MKGKQSLVAILAVIAGLLFLLQTAAQPFRVSLASAVGTILFRLFLSVAGSLVLFFGPILLFGKKKAEKRNSRWIYPTFYLTIGLLFLLQTLIPVLRISLPSVAVTLFLRLVLSFFGAFLVLIFLLLYVGAVKRTKRVMWLFAAVVAGCYLIFTVLPPVHIALSTPVGTVFLRLLLSIACGVALLALLYLLIGLHPRSKARRQLQRIYQIADPDERLVVLDAMQQNGRLPIAPGIYDLHRSNAYFFKGDAANTLHFVRRAADPAAHSKLDNNYAYCRVMFVSYLLAFGDAESSRREYERLRAELPDKAAQFHASDLAVMRALLAILARDIPALNEAISELGKIQSPWANFSLAALDLLESRYSEADGQLAILKQNANAEHPYYCWWVGYLERELVSRRTQSNLL